MKHPIAHTKNGIPVYVDLIHSQAASHIAQQPRLLELVKEALKKASARGAEVSIEQDMGRAIGYNFVVETTDKDTVVYAQLMRETIYTRFVKNGKPAPTNYLTLVLRYNDDEGGYELHDTWIGHISPPRPGSENETESSKPYWATHAFVLDGQPLQLRTVTRDCPY
jgi:hypothetical protein